MQCSISVVQEPNFYIKFTPYEVPPQYSIQIHWPYKKHSMGISLLAEDHL
jgi:hypothetical protein